MNVGAVVEYKEVSERYQFLKGQIEDCLLYTSYLVHHFPELPEGQLTKNRAALVCEKSLCGFSKSLQAGDFLRLSHGELHSGGKARPSILADVFESTTAAIYMDLSLIHIFKNIWAMGMKLSPLWAM